MLMCHFPTHYQLVLALRKKNERQALYPHTIIEMSDTGCRTRIGENENELSYLGLALSVEHDGIKVVAIVELIYAPPAYSNETGERSCPTLSVWAWPDGRTKPVRPNFQLELDDDSLSLERISSLILQPIFACAIQSKGSRRWVDFKINPILALWPSMTSAVYDELFYCIKYRKISLHGIFQMDRAALVTDDEIEPIKAKIRELEDKAARELGLIIVRDNEPTQ